MKPKVKDIMTGGVATCAPTDTLQKIAEIMRDNDCGAIPVVDNNQITGIITDRDIVVRAVAAGINPAEITAGPCMTGSVHTISQEAELDDLTDLMEDKQIRRVVVVDGDNKIVGIVAQADVALHASVCEAGDVVRQVSQ